MTVAIVKNWEYCGGKPRLAGTRMYTHCIWQQWYCGASYQEIVSDDIYPHISIEQAAAAVIFEEELRNKYHRTPKEWNNWWFYYEESDKERDIAPDKRNAWRTSVEVLKDQILSGKIRVQTISLADDGTAVDISPEEAWALQERDLRYDH